MRKEKSQQITIKIMARAVIFGGLFGGVMLILMLFLSSFFVLKMKSLSQTAVFAAAIISSCISAFLAGFLASRILKARGIIVGALSALLLFIIVLLTGTIISSDSINLDTLMRFAAMLLSGSFGGINLEDISAPRCFEIERRLQEECDIPVFHDDQHGTAVVTLAAVINALKLTNRKIENIKAVTSGAGAAGIAIVKLLIAMGLKNVIMCDRHGAIYKGRDGQNHEKELIADITNRNCEKGTLAEVIKGADLFIGVSAPNCVTEEMVKSMAPQPILFPMANPDPEILPELAKKAGAAVVGTGRSDYPNQINNVLAFPGIFRGALDVRASRINDEMNIAAARAIAESVPADKLCSEYIIPDALDHQMAQRVAEAVRKAAIETGVARIK